MSNAKSIRPTPAQIAALEQNGIFELDGDAPDDGIREALAQPSILVTPENQRALVSELCELSNSEDALAENMQAKGHAECAKLARRACSALANLSTKIAKVTFD